MRKTNIGWQQREEPRYFPTWLKSYHLLLFAFSAIMIFGAVMKQFSTT